MPGLDFTTIISDVKGVVAKYNSDPTKYGDLLAKGEDGFKAVVNFLDKLTTGNVQAADVQLTEWDDVNATLLADAAQQAQNTNDATAVDWNEVLDIVEKVGRVAALGVSVAATFGAFARKAPHKVPLPARRMLGRMGRIALFADAAQTPVLSGADLEAKAKEIAADICDANGSISWEGIFQAVGKAMEVAEALSTGLPAMTGDQKKALALDLLDKLVDDVNLPGPSFLVKPVVKTLIPYVIDLTCSAANGKLALGQ